MSLSVTLVWWPIRLVAPRCTCARQACGRPAGVGPWAQLDTLLAPACIYPRSCVRCERCGLADWMCAACARLDVHASALDKAHGVACGMAAAGRRPTAHRDQEARTEDRVRTHDSTRLHGLCMYSMLGYQSQGYVTCPCHMPMCISMMAIAFVWYSCKLQSRGLPWPSWPLDPTWLAASQPWRRTEDLAISRDLKSSTSTIVSCCLRSCSALQSAPAPSTHLSPINLSYRTYTSHMYMAHVKTLFLAFSAMCDVASHPLAADR